MIRSLQSTHRVIWLILAIALPVGFVLALMSKPVIPLDEPVLRSSNDAFSQVLKNASTNEFDVNLRGGDDGVPKQLEVIIKKPLTSPSVVVYANFDGNPDIEKDVLIGNLGPQGTYRFLFEAPEGKTDGIGIYFYDLIKKSNFYQTSL
ncbi:MAG: hypothetical protein AAF502_01965 [Bacteroidota bacterium]